MSAVPPAEDAESRQPLMAEGGETGAAEGATQFVVQGVPLAAEQQQQHSFKNGANPARDVEQVVGRSDVKRSSAPAPDEQVVQPAVEDAPRSTLCGVWVRLGWKRLLYLVFAVVATFLLVYAKINARNGLTGYSGDWFYALTFLLLAFLCPAAPKVESGAAMPTGGRAECTSQSAKAAANKAIELQAAKAPASTAAAAPLTAGTTAQKAAGRSSPSAKPRLLFLDNLKVFLTFAVVFFHVSVGFGGWKWQAYTLTLGNHEDNHLGKALSVINLINQSYFMSLFFFISGFFVPSSLQRKGAGAFLEDKFMRLGLPLVLGGFLFFPLTAAASYQAAFGTDYGAVNPDGASPLHLVQNLMQAPELWYVVGLGPLWFLQALLVFNLVFCVLYPKGLDSMGKGGLPLPGLGEMLLVGSLFGLLQGWTLQDGFGWQNSGRFAFLDVPNLYGGGGGLFFDILFFFAGAFAKKNNWLEQIVEMSVRPTKKSTREDDEKHEVADIEEGRVDENKAAASEKMTPASSRSRWSIWGCRLHAAVIVGCIIALTVTIDPKLAPPQHSRCGHFQQAVAKQFAKEPEIYNRLFPELPIEKAAAKEWALNYPPAAPRDTTPQEERPWSQREGWLQDQLLKGNSLFWHVLRGQLSITLSFVLLQFFAQFANGEAPEQKGWNQFKKALGEGAYGVYLFHWMVWPLFLWLFLSRMYPSLRGEEATASEESLEFLFCADRMFAAKGPISQPLMGALFALTFLSTNLLLWPLCFYLRKIPGLDKVL